MRMSGVPSTYVDVEAVSDLARGLAKRLSARPVDPFRRVAFLGR